MIIMDDAHDLDHPDEQRYRLLAQTMPQGVVHQDAAGHVLAMNPAAEQILGPFRDELLSAIVHQESNDMVREDGSSFPRDEHPSRIALQTGKPVHGVVMGIFHRADNDYRWIRIDATPVVHPGDSAPSEVFTVFEDVTDRRRADVELRDSKERVRLATEATAVGIWQWNVVTNRIRWDGQMFRIYGIAPTADGFIEYDAWSSSVVPEDLALQEKLLRETMEKRVSRTRDFRIHRQDNGAIRYIQAVETVRTDNQGKVAWVLGTNLDVTHLRQNEDRLREMVALADQRSTELAGAKAVAEAANRAKDQFLAVLSHELRTPLTPVLATSMILESDARLAADQLEMVQMIRRNVELEARLIDDLLDITRISRNKLELDHTVLDVHRKIKNVIGICQGDALAKNQVVSVDLSAARHHVDGDAARFQQIIWNLLKNAVKFTPVNGRITISTSNPTPDRLVVVVTDNGVGIDAEAFPKIFDAFEQGGREVTRRFGGLGLGLAISRALVEMHGGTISAYSAGTNSGATFTVDIPTSSGTAAVQGSTPNFESKAMNCRILLVEDHVDTRRIMTRLLQTMACSVKAAGSVAEALKLATENTFDLVISDIGLPDAAGTDLMRELQLKYNLQGIALSGYGMDEDLQRSKAAGFSLHLTKPVNIEELKQAVQRLISKT